LLTAVTDRCCIEIILVGKGSDKQVKLFLPCSSDVLYLLEQPATVLHLQCNTVACFRLMMMMDRDELLRSFVQSTTLLLMTRARTARRFILSVDPAVLIPLFDGTSTGIWD